MTTVATDPARVRPASLGPSAILTALLWLVLSLLLLMAILTWWQPGSSIAIIGLTAAAPVLYLVAWPCAVVAGLRRNRAALVVALALCVAQLAFVVPSMHPWSTAAAPSGRWRMTIYDQNVLYTNFDLGGIAHEISQDAPDVITLEELSFENVSSLEASGVLSAYRYHYEDLAYNSDGFGIWSKIPLTGGFWLAPGHPEFSGVLHPKGQPQVSLLVVHTDAPVTGIGAQYWTADQKVIAQKIQGSPHPVVVVGDFNATMAMRAFRPVLGAGVQDAGTATGEGWQMTWPADHPNVPQLVRIDHLLYSAGLTVTSYRLGVSAGSDHRPLLVTVAHATAPGRHK